MKTNKPHYVTDLTIQELAEKIKKPLVKFDAINIGIEVIREDKKPYYVIVYDGMLYEDYLFDIKRLSEETVKKLKLSRYVKLITPQQAE